MPDAYQLLAFAAAGWLLNLTPGPDVLYIVTHSLRSGWRSGFVAGLGITAGCLVHVIAAALGVGALLATSATAFTALKWIGASYLVWMGVRALAAGPTGRAPDLESLARELPLLTPQQVFRGGFWTNVLNPKVALFFLAFLPQFISPDASDKTILFLGLGLLFNLNSMPINAGWAVAAAWMARGPVVQRGMRWLDKLAGAMFIIFGLKLAMVDRPGV